MGKAVRHGCCLSPILFNFHIEYLTKETLEWFEYFKLGGEVMPSVKYAEDFVPQSKE
jgi:hypothetical protein